LSISEIISEADSESENPAAVVSSESDDTFVQGSECDNSLCFLCLSIKENINNTFSNLEIGLCLIIQNFDYDVG